MEYLADEKDIANKARKASRSSGTPTTEDNPRQIANRVQKWHFDKHWILFAIMEVSGHISCQLIDVFGVGWLSKYEIW